jgi:hypothetical protein
VSGESNATSDFDVATRSTRVIAREWSLSDDILAEIVGSPLDLRAAGTLIGIFNDLRAIFGDDSLALSWITTPHAAFQGRRPLDAMTGQDLARVRAFTWAWYIGPEFD